MKATDENLFACELFNERQASLALELTKEQNKQDDIRAMNRESDNKEAARKEQSNSKFWHRVMNVLTVIAIAIVIYTLMHFAGLI